MSMPLIDPLPPAPTPADPEDVFDGKAYETVAALAPFVEQTNVLALAVEAEAIRSESEADRSQAQVNVATTEANRAQTEAERAKDEADRAEQARDDAVVVVTEGQGSLTPAPGKFPVAGTSGTIKQGWIENLQFELDALRVTRNKLMYGDGPYPVLDLQFQGAKHLDPRVTFTRATPDWDWEGKRYEVDEPVLSNDGLWMWGARTNLFAHAINLSTSTPNTSRAGNLENTTGEGRFTQGVTLLHSATGSSFYALLPGLEASNRHTFTAYISVEGGGKPMIGHSNHDASLDAAFVGFGTFSVGILNPKTTLEHYRGDIWKFTATYSRAEGAAPSTGFAKFTNNNTRPLTVWAIQLEVGEVGTPLIPTNGSQVTVAASTLEVKGAAFESVFNPHEGALVWGGGENRYRSSGNTHPYANFGVLGSGASTSTGGLFVFGSRFVYRDAFGSEVSRVDLSKNPSDMSDGFKIGVAYEKNRSLCSVNENLVYMNVDSTGFMKATASRIYVSPLTNGYVRSLSYYDRALTVEQLQELTS